MSEARDRVNNAKFLSTHSLRRDDVLATEAYFGVRHGRAIEILKELKIEGETIERRRALSRSSRMDAASAVLLSQDKEVGMLLRELLTT